MRYRPAFLVLGLLTAMHLGGTRLAASEFPRQGSTCFWVEAGSDPKYTSLICWSEEEVWLQAVEDQGKDAFLDWCCSGATSADFEGFPLGDQIIQKGQWLNLKEGRAEKLRPPLKEPWEALKALKAHEDRETRKAEGCQGTRVEIFIGEDACAYCITSSDDQAPSYSRWMERPDSAPQSCVNVDAEDATLPGLVQVTEKIWHSTVVPRVQGQLSLQQYLRGLLKNRYFLPCALVVGTLVLLARFLQRKVLRRNPGTPPLVRRRVVKLSSDKAKDKDLKKRIEALEKELAKASEKKPSETLETKLEEDWERRLADDAWLVGLDHAIGQAKNRTADKKKSQTIVEETKTAKLRSSSPAGVTRPLGSSSSILVSDAGGSFSQGLRLRRDPSPRAPFVVETTDEVQGLLKPNLGRGDWHPDWGRYFGLTGENWRVADPGPGISVHNRDGFWIRG